MAPAKVFFNPIPDNDDEEFGDFFCAADKPT